MLSWLLERATAGWQNAPAYSQIVVTRGGASYPSDLLTELEHKNTRNLEWFGPPERNTLRPLRVVLFLGVGTPGLGYPLLLCLGKGLVVILDYVQTTGPLWSGVLFSRQRSRTCLTAGKGPGTPCVPEVAGAQLEQPGLRTPAEVPDPSWGPGPPV